MTVAATRRASRINRGMLAAGLPAVPTARATVGPSWYVRCCVDLDSAAIRLSDPSLQSRNHRLDAFAFRARAESQCHAVLEHGLGEFDELVDRRRETAVEEGAGAHREHERLAGARARTPGNQF